MSKAAQLQKIINKALGDETLRMGSDDYFAVRYLPTGVLPVDVMLGGGFPVGRITEIYGDFSSLKSWVALRAIATSQQDGKTAALIDTEHAFDPAWAVECGVDLSALVVAHPDTGEDAIAMTEIMIHEGVDLIIWDSVAATQPKQELDKKPDQAGQPARRAAMMSKGLSRLTSMNKNQTALVMINQTRTNAGMTFGSSEVVPGGKALPFYASMRVRMQRAGKVTERVKMWNGEAMVDIDKTIGYRIKCQLVKSKLSKPYGEMWFIFDNEEGDINIPEWLVGQAQELGLVKNPSKGWYEIDGKKQRRKELVERARTDEEFAGHLLREIQAEWS